jgi:hypothetical protein
MKRYGLLNKKVILATILSGLAIYLITRYANFSKSVFTLVFGAIILFVIYFGLLMLFKAFNKEDIKTIKYITDEVFKVLRRKK